MRRVIIPFILSLLSVSAGATVAIDWVTIGNPGNPARSPANSMDGSGGTPGGSVAYTYQMSRNEITISQYVEFLNATASIDDRFGLYDEGINHSGGGGGIARKQLAERYEYSVIGNGKIPVTFVSIYDAARFCNWLHNGQKTGDAGMQSVEIGAYSLGGVTMPAPGSGISPPLIPKRVGATVWIPSEDEWSKAAYFDPTQFGGSGGYWLHANRSNSVPGNSFTQPGGVNFFDGNYAQDENGLLGRLTDVGAYGEASRSYYGMNDMAGNVAEWVGIDGSRSLRGGHWAYVLGGGSGHLISSWGGPLQYGDYQLIGFRVAGAPSPVMVVVLDNGTEVTDGGSLPIFLSEQPTRRITIRNPGLDALRGVTTAIQGPMASDFEIVTGLPETIESGSEAQMELRFNPSAGGLRAASMVLQSAAPVTQQLTIQLQGKIPTESEKWRLMNFGSIANSGAGSDSSDPDGDDQVNMVEFAFGTDPNRPTEGQAEIVKNGSVLEYRYWRSKSAASELTFVREFAASPSGPWQQTGGTAETIISDDGVRQRVLVTTPASSAIERRFVRLRVTRR
jgi:sulfatase modifying factor 1